MTTEQQRKNLLAVVSRAIEELRCADFQARRRAVMFVSTMLGHRMGVEQLREQPWGVVGQCANCGQIAKAPREGDTVEGRATTTFCPAVRDESS